MGAIAASPHPDSANDNSGLARRCADGVDRFLTNNRADFPRAIAEIDVVYPEDLPLPGVAGADH